MTLPATGELSMSMINVEIGANANSPLNLNHPDVRQIAGLPVQNSQISFADLRGKSYFTYRLYRDYIINQGTNDKEPVDGWGYCEGYQIVVDAPFIKIVGAKGYAENGSLMFDMPLRWGTNQREFQLMTKPSRVTRGVRIDPTCIQNPYNSAWISVGFIGTSILENVKVYRIEVVSDTGTVYELHSHRNFEFIYPQFDFNQQTQVSFFQNHPRTLIPPNK